MQTRCLFYKKDDNNKVILMIVVYVDDVFVAGELKEIERLKNEVKSVYNITDLGELHKHYGIWYNWSKDIDGNKMVM